MRSFKRRIAKRNKTQKAHGWSPMQRWMATGALAFSGLAGRSNVAWAQQSADPTKASSSPRAVRFDIPKGALDVTLAGFVKATGFHVDVAESAILTVGSPGATGSYTPEAALDLLLTGTGLAYRFTSPTNVILEISKFTTSVDVIDVGAALAVSSPKYAGPLLDTPQTIDVIGQKTMQEQNITTLRDAVRNVAGISIAAGEAGAQGDNLTIRGFSARNDLYIDGMRDFGSYYRDPFNLEEVQVIQGPDSTNFGRGSTGGVVNQSTKFANMNRSIAGTLDLGSANNRRATADVNAPFSLVDIPSSFRLNIMGQENGVAGRPSVVNNRRYGIGPSLSFGLGKPTRVVLSGLHQQADDVPDYGIPWLFNSPAPVSRSNYYGFTGDNNYLRTRDNIATLRVEHDFGSFFTLRNQTRYARYDRDVLITEPQATLTTTTGVAPGLSTPLSQILVNRNELANNSTESFLANQTDLSMHFKTWFIEHHAVTGAEVDREDSSPYRVRFTGVPSASLLNPVMVPFAGVAAPNSDVRARSKTAATYLMDTMNVGRHLVLSGSMRFDHFNTAYTQAIPPAVAFNRIDKMPSWHGSIVYKPIDAASLYASAGTSFNPSAESLALSAATANLPPEKNRTVELGMKWDLRQPRLSLHAAWFNTDKYNAREPDPTNSLLNVLSGGQRVRGFETGLNGHIINRWDMQASYAYLDAKVVSSNAFPAAIGARLANVPANTLSFWNTFRLPFHTTIGGGGNFVGARTSSSTVPLDPITKLVKQAPEYWVFNAMIQHPLTERITLHANVYNLADRYYYDQLHPSHIILGPARSVLVGIRFRL